MKTTKKHKQTMSAAIPREPLYASLWLALFSDLRREFVLARNAR
jgi:hypothetical protein